MKKIITSIFLLAGALYSEAQIAPSWVKYSAPSNYQNYDAQDVSVGIDSLGNVYTGASASDTINNHSQAMLVKHNSAGVQQWIRFYDNNDPAPYKNGTFVVSVLVDKAGNSYVCGQGRHGTSGTDIMAIKYDNAGNQLWIRYWDGGQNIDDYATCATFDKAGNILVGGYANKAGNTYDDMAVVKWSAAGVALWNYTYNNTGIDDEDRVLSIAADKHNEIFITGSSFGTSHRDMVTIKLNSAGVNQWTKRIPHSSSADERGYSVTADTSGNSYVTGSAPDWITIKYSPAGSVLWTDHYTVNTDNIYDTRKVMLDKFNNVIIAGNAFVSSANQTDLVLAKINNTNGSEMWSVSLNVGGIDNFTDAAVDTNGFIYISGYYDGPLGTDMEAMIFSPAGSLMWNSTFTNPSRSSGTDEPYKMIVDNNRNIILAGTAERRGSGSDDAVDVVTLKYNTSTVGIHELSAQKLSMKMYPNPAKDQLTISITDQTSLGSKIVIYNMIGQTVLETTITALDQQLNLNGLTKGIYMLTIKNETSSASKKLIIE